VVEVAWKDRTKPRLDPSRPDCNRLKNAASRARKARFLRALKLTCGCIDCGYREDAALLSFDHRPGTVKDFNVCRGVNRGVGTVHR
jgi:hypothetical protein